MALKQDDITLLDLINDGRRNQYNIKNCSIMTRIGDDLLNIGGVVFDKYIDFIKANTVQVKLTLEEQNTYKYNPKKLSLLLYGTEELWFLILRLNNVGSEIEFKPKKVSLLDPSQLDLLNKILIVNDDLITQNHEELGI